MKKAVLILGFLIVALLGVKSFTSSLEEPAEGEVVVVVEAPVEVETPAEEPVEEAEEPKEEPKEEPVEEPVVFKPLPFKGNIYKLQKEYGGKIIDVSVDARARAVGGKKGLDVGDAIYFKGKKRKLYVFIKATRELRQL